MAYAAGAGSQADTGNTEAVQLMEVEDIFYKLLERIIANYDPTILKGRPFCFPWCDRRKALADTYNSIFRSAKIRLPARESIWSKANDLHSYEPCGREIAIANYVTLLHLEPEHTPYTAKGVFDNRRGRGRRR